MEETKDHIYQAELFERLKKSAGLKTGQESFGCYLKPTLWWIIEKPNPKIHEMTKIISGKYQILLLNLSIKLKQPKIFIIFKKNLKIGVNLQLVE